MSRQFIFPASAVLSVLIALAAGCAMQPDTLAMRAVTSPEGYTGRAFYRNGMLASEELDATGNDGKVDLWRYYLNNRLVREDFDTTGTGIISMRKRYNEDGVLIEVLTDTTGNGRLDHVVKVQPVAAKAPRSRRPANSYAEETPAPAAAPVETADNASESVPTIRNNVSTDDGYSRTGSTSSKRNVGAGELFDNNSSSAQSSYSQPAPVAQETTPAPATYDSAPARSTGESSRESSPASGSVIERIEPAASGSGSYYGTNRGIVPGPVFKHPSAGLEE